MEAKLETTGVIGHDSPMDQSRKRKKLEKAQDFIDTINAYVNSLKENMDYEKQIIEPEIIMSEDSKEDVKHEIFFSDNTEQLSQDSSVSTQREGTSIQSTSSHSQEIQELRKWLCESNISHEHGDKLLQILRYRLIPSLPSTTKDFLANDRINNKASQSYNGNTEIISELLCPELESTSFQHKTGFETAVLTALSELRREVAEIKRNQDEASNYFFEKKPDPLLISDVDFNEKYQLVLPFTTVESFNQFNDVLKDNLFLRNDVYMRLCQCVDKNFSITRSFVNMLKTFLSKNVAMQYTAVRRSSVATKLVFKGLEFCKLMDAVVVEKRRCQSIETTDRDLISGLSDVLCNTKNWNKKEGKSASDVNCL